MDGGRPNHIRGNRRQLQSRIHAGQPARGVAKRDLSGERCSRSDDSHGAGRDGQWPSRCFRCGRADRFRRCNRRDGRNGRDRKSGDSGRRRRDGRDGSTGHSWHCGTPGARHGATGATGRGLQLRARCYVKDGTTTPIVATDKRPRRDTGNGRDRRRSQYAGSGYLPGAVGSQAGSDVLTNGAKSDTAFRRCLTGATGTPGTPGATGATEIRGLRAQRCDGRDGQRLRHSWHCRHSGRRRRNRRDGTGLQLRGRWLCQGRQLTTPHDVATYNGATYMASVAIADQPIRRIRIQTGRCWPRPAPTGERCNG